MKILVTGVSGCIGTAVAKELLRKGYEVIGLDSQALDKNFTHEKLKFVNGSILDTTFLRDMMHECDAVIHLAAHLGVKRTEINRLRCLDINVEGTKNVLEAARKCLNLKAIISVTTDKCYENKEWEW